MDKVWIITTKDSQIPDGPEIYSYEGLFFTTEEAAKEYIKTIQFNYGFDVDVKELNLYSEHLV